MADLHDWICSSINNCLSFIQIILDKYFSFWNICTPCFNNYLYIKSDNKTYYKLYIWIDGSLVNNDNSNDILSSVYKGNISMSIESGDK